MSEQISIAIVDDHPMFLEGLKRVFRLATHVVVAAEASNAEGACRIAKEIKPDIMLLDLGIPGDGIIAAQTIADTSPEVKVIALTASDDDEKVDAALSAGVKGYLLKGAGAAELISAISAVHDGRPYVTPALASRLLVQKVKGDTVQLALQRRLTSRELEILKCAAEGLTNKEIAGRLGLRVRSVKNCMSRILLKLGARNRLDAIMMYGRS